MCEKEHNHKGYCGKVIRVHLGKSLNKIKPWHPCHWGPSSGTAERLLLELLQANYTSSSMTLKGPHGSPVVTLHNYWNKNTLSLSAPHIK